jgi:pyruvate formate lyase activating enzyme
METNNHCSVCIRECEIGKSFCHRRNEKGLLIDRDRFCAVTVDSLFDKPIVHFRGNLRTLSIGSWGCNLRCLGCQNVKLSWSENGKEIPGIEITPEEIIDMAVKKDCRAICYTFNEPAVLLEAVEEIAKKAKKKGLYNILVTNSTLTERSTHRIACRMDAIAADIKSMNDDFYYNYCGAEGIAEVAVKILKCIKAFYEAGCHVEVRTNIIPGANDQEENYHEIATWIKETLDNSVPWHITRFFPANKLIHLCATPSQSLLDAQKAGQEKGLKYVFTYMDKGCDCAREKYMAELISNSCPRCS